MGRPYSSTSVRDPTVPLFLEQMIYTSHNVSNVEECAPHSMEDYRKELWNEVLE